MGTTAKAGGTEFPKAPVGAHVARCYQVIDLGHQKSTFDGKEKWLPKIMLSWELLGSERMQDGKPFSISSRYTLSLSEKGNLRPLLESWRGKPFNNPELDGFDIKNVLGKYCLLNVIHNSEGSKTYANVASVMALPKGFDQPSPVNATLYFNLDTDGLEVLPEWIANAVRKSRELTESDIGGTETARRKRSFEEEMEDQDVTF